MKYNNNVRPKNCQKNININTEKLQETRLYGTFKNNGIKMALFLSNYK